MQFVWDTSAIVNIKEPNEEGYSPAHSLIKDLSDGWISGPYTNLFPSLAVFEVAATVSRMHRDGRGVLREFYLLDDHSVIYPVDEDLVSKGASFLAQPGFDQLRGADLVFACIAAIEDAYLVTLDKAFVKHLSRAVNVLDLNASIRSPKYRETLGI